MRKLSFTPLLALLMGLAGAVVRYQQLKTGFEPISGMPVPGDGSAGLLTILGAVVLALSAILALALGWRHSLPKSYGKAFHTARYLSFVLSTLTGCVSILGAGILFSTSELFGLAGFARYVFLGLAALSGVGMLVMSAAGYTGKSGPGLMLFSVMPPVFFAYTLTCLYRANASNPFLWDFAPGCLAVGLTAMALCTMAGCAYSRRLTRGLIFYGHLAVYAILVTLPDSHPLGFKLILAAAAVFTLQQLVRAISALEERSSEQDEEE